jgi:hypothetical protein
VRQEIPHLIHVIHKGNCDRWRSGVDISWVELRDFVSPEGFARWVNYRLLKLLPDEEPLVQLIASMWPLVLRETSQEEAKVCRDRLEAELWYGRPLTRTKGARRDPGAIVPESE